MTGRTHLNITVHKYMHIEKLIIQTDSISHSHKTRLAKSRQHSEFQYTVILPATV